MDTRAFAVAADFVGLTTDVVEAANPVNSVGCGIGKAVGWDTGLRGMLLPHGTQAAGVWFAADDV